MNSIYDSNNSSKSNPVKKSLKKNSEGGKFENKSLEERNQIACWFNFDKKNIMSNENSTNKKASKSLESPSKRWGHTSLVYNNTMYIFGGRYSSRNLANIFAFNLENFFWYKVEPIGQIPPARDSHSILLVIPYFISL